MTKDDAAMSATSPNYAELLLDPRWQRRRLEILSRDDWQCQCCGESKKTLHVHHRNAYRPIAPWEYGHDELQTLCETCHGKLRGVRPGSVQLEQGGYSYDGYCPWCGSGKMKDKGSYDMCLDCGGRTCVFYPG